MAKIELLVIKQWYGCLNMKTPLTQLLSTIDVIEVVFLKFSHSPEIKFEKSLTAIFSLNVIFVELPSYKSCNQKGHDSNDNQRPIWLINFGYTKCNWYQ